MSTAHYAPKSREASDCREEREDFTLRERLLVHFLLLAIVLLALLLSSM